MTVTVVAAVEVDDHGSVPSGSLEVVALTRSLSAPPGSVRAVALRSDVTPEECGMRLARLVMDTRPAAVVAPASDYATEAMAHAAAVTNLPLACNCVSVSAGDDVWTVTRGRGGGVLLEEATLVAATKLVTLSAGNLDPGAVDVPELHDLPEHTGLPVRARLVERATASFGGVSLATAQVVVSGGRGVGSAAGFGALEDLAELLGGAVGCSRVVTNNGWRPHSDQVGQTGTKVSPNLYIAAGISGATQHWAGCMSSKKILAINTDPEAPMVTRSDYAVIGDAVDVVQAIADEVRRRKPHTAPSR